MGNESYILDMHGFEINTYDSSLQLILETLYHAFGEEDRERIYEDIGDDEDRKIAYQIFDSIKKLDEKIWIGVSNECTGSIPLYVGWSDISETTVEKKEALKKIFNIEKIKIEDIEKDRFVTYG